MFEFLLDQNIKVLNNRVCALQIIVAQLVAAHPELHDSPLILAALEVLRVPPGKSNIEAAQKMKEVSDESVKQQTVKPSTPP